MEDPFLKRYFQTKQTKSKPKIPQLNSESEIPTEDQRMLSSKFRFYRFNKQGNESVDNIAQEVVKDYENKPISALIKDARREYIESLKAQIEKNREQINALTNVNRKRKGVRQSVQAMPEQPS